MLHIIQQIVLVNNDRREDCGNGNNKLKNIWKSANVIWKHINISTFFKFVAVIGVRFHYKKLIIPIL